MLLGLVFSLAAALPAAALSLSPNPLGFDDGEGISGGVELVGSQVGALPSGGVVLYDPASRGILANDTVLMFQASFDTPTELAAIVFGVHPLPGQVEPAVIGWVPGLNTDIIGAGEFTGLDPRLSVEFDTGLSAGPVSTTDVFFISYAPLAGSSLDDLVSTLNPGSIRLDVLVPGAGFVFTETGQMVPEPGTALLLGAGLLGLAGAGRRRA